MVMGYFNAKVGNDNVGRDHVMGREGVQAEKIREESKTAWKKICDVGLGKKNFPTQLKALRGTLAKIAYQREKKEALNIAKIRYAKAQRQAK